MSSTRPSAILPLAGLAAAVVTIAVGLSWKQIYWAIWPETRFWGRWAVVEPPDVFPGLSMSVTLEFRESGEMGYVAEFARPKPLGREPLTALAPYRVSGDKLVLTLLDFVPFSGDIEMDSGDFITVDTGSRVVETRYRFETDDSVTLESETRVPLGTEKTIRLRRLPDTEYTTD